MNTYIIFHNTTELPVNVNSWIDGSSRLNRLKVNPGEKRIIPSSLNEWYIDTMFDDFSERQVWVEKGFDKYFTIGKFRSKPFANGNYSWMEYDEPFECLFVPSKNEENKIQGRITFVQKNKNNQ